MNLATKSASCTAIETHLSEKVAHDDIDVPLLPEVAGKVVKLTQDPDSDATSLAKLVQSDQPLASHIMRVANSAAYSPNSSMVSLQQAIARLGMKTISEIALAASINSSLFNAPGYEEHIKSELQIALATALWAKEVARTCRRNVEAAFISGLLHDIGRPVAVQAIAAASQILNITLSLDEVISLENQYQRAFGIKVVEKWQMPIPVVNTVRYFDDYTQSHDTNLQTMIVVGGAKFVKHFMCEPGKMVCLTLEELKAEKVLGNLDLYQNEVELLLEKEAQIKSAMEAMSA